MAQCVCGSSSQASDIVYWLGLPSIDRALCFLMPSSGQINTRSSGLLDDLFLLCVHLSSAQLTCLGLSRARCMISAPDLRICRLPNSDDRLVKKKPLLRGA